MLRSLILLAWLVSFALNAPGQLTTDSVVQLLEGRSGFYKGSHPPLMSALLGAFDHIVQGTALYLVFSTALFYLPLMLLVGPDRGRTSLNWLSAAFLAFLLATPFLVIYQGTVWKDVLFANLSLSAFTCLVLAQRHYGQPRGRLAWLGLAAFLAALAASTRQNGLIVILFAAVAIGVTVPAPSSLWTRATHGLVWLLLAVGVLIGSQWTIQATARQPIGSSIGWGVKVVHRYDMTGMIANGASPLPSEPASSPESQRIIALVEQYYDPSRVDPILKSRDLRNYFREMERMRGQWWRMVRENPLGWLEHRASIFGWMIAPPDVRRCVPVTVGVDGPDTVLATLGLQREMRPQDRAMYAYATRWFDTPLFINAAWALLALALAGVIAVRKCRAPGDPAMVGLLASGVTFAASFALIGIACDVRYMFLLPVACCGALAHLAHVAPRPPPEA